MKSNAPQTSERKTSEKKRRLLAQANQRVLPARKQPRGSPSMSARPQKRPSSTSTLSLTVRRQAPLSPRALHDPESLVEALAHPRFEAHTEIEVPYFSTLAHLSSMLKLQELPSQHIFQAYIPEKNLHEILLRLGSASALLPALEASMLSRARLRRTIDLSTDSTSSSRYYLQLKTAKGGGLSRTELGIEIPAARFFKLLPLATAGAVEKLRYIQRGEVRAIRGKMHLAEAHFDVLLNAGANTKLQMSTRRSAERSPFSFIDVELPSAQLIPLLAEPRRHSFAFLSCATPVLDHERWIQKVTGTRAIARNGLHDRTFKKALRQLTAGLPAPFSPSK